MWVYSKERVARDHKNRREYLNEPSRHYVMADGGYMCTSCVLVDEYSIISAEAELHDEAVETGVSYADDQWLIAGMQYNTDEDALICDHCHERIPTIDETETA